MRILCVCRRHNADVLFLSSRSFDFKEKALVDKYYPQFYHKTDKVCPPYQIPSFVIQMLTTSLLNRMADQSTSNVSACLMSTNFTKSRPPNDSFKGSYSNTRRTITNVCPHAPKSLATPSRLHAPSSISRVSVSPPSTG